MSSKNRKQDTKVNDELRSRTTESASMTIQNGDVRAAILSLIQNDDDIMKKILETVTQAIIQKLMDSPNFLEKLAKNVLKNGVLDNIKQDIYESCAVDNGHTTDTIRNLERRVVDLERANKELRDDSDTQEQYSHRNCLLLHGENPELFSNYRLISIFPCLSKILECLMYNKLYNFLAEHNIISKKQYGFRKNYSTYMALIDLVDKISSNMDHKKYNIGVFLDLSKDFDTIDPNI